MVVSLRKASRRCDKTLLLVLRLLQLLITALVIAKETAKVRQSKTEEEEHPQGALTKRAYSMGDTTTVPHNVHVRLNVGGAHLHTSLHTVMEGARLGYGCFQSLCV